MNRACSVLFGVTAFLFAPASFAGSFEAKVACNTDAAKVAVINYLGTPATRSKVSLASTVYLPQATTTAYYFKFGGGLYPLSWFRKGPPATVGLPVTSLSMGASNSLSTLGTVGVISLPATVQTSLHDFMLRVDSANASMNAVACVFARERDAKTRSFPSWDALSLSSLRAIGGGNISIEASLAQLTAPKHAFVTEEGSISDPQRVAALFLVPNAPAGGTVRTSIGIAPDRYDPTTEVNDTEGDCLSDLRQRGIPFEATAARRGIVDPVSLRGPITNRYGSMEFHYVGTPGKLDRSAMACEFLRHSIIPLAELAAQKGFVRAVTQGAYCYRYANNESTKALPNYKDYLECGMPKVKSPDPKRLSNHSFGRAIDITKLFWTDNSELDLTKDFARISTKWVDERTTCAPESIAKQTSLKSNALYQFYCDLLASPAKPFHDGICPNDNSAHRDHFHLDRGRVETGDE